MMYRKLSREELMDALEQRPDLYRQIEEMIRIRENPYDEIMLIDDAEERVLEVVMAAGKATLEDWAQRRSTLVEHQLEAQGMVGVKNQKKCSGTVRSERS